jgi:hypothetical protein
MPRKQHTLSDSERAKRIREAAQKLGAEAGDTLERVFHRIVPPKHPSSKANPRNRKPAKP